MVCLCLIFLKKNLSKKEAGQYRVHQSEERESGPKAMAAAQVETNGRGEEAQGQIRPTGPQRTDGGSKPEKADGPERTSKLKPHPSREQLEGRGR